VTSSKIVSNNHKRLYGLVWLGVKPFPNVLNKRRHIIVSAWDGLLGAMVLQQ
jgi:hypothetical protein